jgi:hypothetical protein
MMGQPVRAARALRALAAALLLAAGCYDVPEPECGFRCGPGNACPEHYTCNEADGRCHRDGAPASLVCGTVDAAIDAPVDAAPPDAI